MRTATVYAVSVTSAVALPPWAARIYRMGDEFEASPTGDDQEGYPYKAFESHTDAQTWELGFEGEEIPPRVI